MKDGLLVVPKVDFSLALRLPIKATIDNNIPDAIRAHPAAPDIEGLLLRLVNERILEVIVLDHLLEETMGIWRKDQEKYIAHVELLRKLCRGRIMRGTRARLCAESYYRHPLLEDNLYYDASTTEVIFRSLGRPRFIRATARRVYQHKERHRRLEAIRRDRSRQRMREHGFSLKTADEWIRDPVVDDWCRDELRAPVPWGLKTGVDPDMNLEPFPTLKGVMRYRLALIYQYNSTRAIKPSGSDLWDMLYFAAADAYSDFLAWIPMPPGQTNCASAR